MSDLLAPNDPTQPGVGHDVDDRGFKRYDEIPTAYGHLVRVYESSAADDPHLWMQLVGPADCAVYDDRARDIAAHLTLDQAQTVIATLTAAIAQHYQRTHRAAAGPQPEDLEVDPRAVQAVEVGSGAYEDYTTLAAFADPRDAEVWVADYNLRHITEIAEGSMFPAAISGTLPFYPAGEHRADEPAPGGGSAPGRAL